MSCEYCYYNNDTYYPKLLCKINDNKLCFYSKRCDKVYKYIPLEDAQMECYLMIEQKQKDIPKNSYYIQTFRFNKKGNLILYVVTKDGIKKLKTEFKESPNQEYVYIKDINSNNCKISYTPFRSYTKRVKDE